MRHEPHKLSCPLPLHRSLPAWPAADSLPRQLSHLTLCLTTIIIILCSWRRHPPPRTAPTWRCPRSKGRGSACCCNWLRQPACKAAVWPLDLARVAGQPDFCAAAGTHLPVLTSLGQQTVPVHRTFLLRSIGQIRSNLLSGRLGPLHTFRPSHLPQPPPNPNPTNASNAPLNCTTHQPSAPFLFPMRPQVFLLWARCVVERPCFTLSALLA